MNEFIDHTLLKPQATAEQISTLCTEARLHNFKSVCVNPSWVSLCKEQLKESDVEVCTVIGFPLGATSTKSKAYEAQVALEDGADELDMVINVGALLSGNYDYVRDDILQVVQAAQKKVVKVILETCLLDEKQIRKACELAIQAGAHFVKTSTGFSTSGANEQVVKTMLDAVDGRAKVKASGGVRSVEDAKTYIDLGVKRLGTSSGVAIVKGYSGSDEY